MSTTEDFARYLSIFYKVPWSIIFWCKKSYTLQTLKIYTRGIKKICNAIARSENDFRMLCYSYSSSILEVSYKTHIQIFHYWFKVSRMNERTFYVVLLKGIGEKKLIFYFYIKKQSHTEIVYFHFQASYISFFTYSRTFLSNKVHV